MKNKVPFYTTSNFFLIIVLLVTLFSTITFAREKTDIKELPLLVKSSKLTSCILKLPQDFDSRKSYPLLVIFHGNGGNAQSFSGIWTGFTKPGFIMAVPQGPYIFPGAFKAGKPMFTWYLPTRDKKIWEIADPLTEDFIINLIDQLVQKYKVKKIFLLGFSQGAALAYAVGIKNHSRIDGIICVSGIFPKMFLTKEQVAAGTSLPVMVAVGDKDTLISVPSVISQKNYLEKSGYKVTDFVYRGGHQITRELLKKVQEWMKKNNLKLGKQRMEHDANWDKLARAFYALAHNDFKKFEELPSSLKNTEAGKLCTKYIETRDHDLVDKAGRLLTGSKQWYIYLGRSF